MFYFDPRALHWPTYVENYCLGAKKYLLNEDLASVPAAKAHLRKYVVRSLINKTHGQGLKNKYVIRGHPGDQK
jgi:hypothetical protein